MLLHKPSQLEAKTRDGRQYSVDLTGGMHETVYSIGEYEPAITELISAIVKNDDVCLTSEQVSAGSPSFFICLQKTRQKTNKISRLCF